MSAAPTEGTKMYSVECKGATFGKYSGEKLCELSFMFSRRQKSRKIDTTKFQIWEFDYN